VAPADSDWLISGGLDNARISKRISASRSGGSGDVLINVIDAAELKLCLLLHLFFLTVERRCKSDLFPPEISSYSRARE
jgi:hypothetical protein